jgi:hypothetical protein
MSQSLTGSYAAVLTLSPSHPTVNISGEVAAYGTLPLTLATGATIGAAVYGPAGTAFTLTNNGDVFNTAAAAYEFGIVLASGGGITNNGVIDGPGGIAIFGSGASVSNSGPITGNSNDGIYFQNAGFISNNGIIASDGLQNGIAIYHAGGAVVTNANGGVISGYQGIYLAGGAGTVMNAGTIAGAVIGIDDQDGQSIVIQNTGVIEATGSNALDGIAILGTATITNGSATATKAVISGGIIFTSPFPGQPSVASAGYVTNYGSILGGVNMKAGTIINGSNADTSALISETAAFHVSAEIAGTAARIENYGTIFDTSTYTSPQSVNGASGGVWLMGNNAVFINGSASDSAAVVHNATGVDDVELGKNGTIVNYGSLLGGSVIGVYLASGTLSNAGTGVILGGKYGAHVAGYGNVTATNAGTIEGVTGFSAVLQYMYNIDLTNAGTIASTSGTAGTAVDLGSGTNILKVDPGASFIGKVIGGTGHDTLELASAVTAGTLSGFGSSFTAFGTILFDAGAAWTIAGTASAFGGETISGFAKGDTIDLQGFTVTSESFVSGAGLELGNGTVTETLAFTGTFDSTSNFAITSDLTGGEFLTVAPCFAARTRIATARGQVAVEDLRIGDLVQSLRGGLTPIKWIGTRVYEGRFIEGNKKVLPIRIRRHALARNVPSRDLYVSPDHAICEGGMLVQAWRLVNGVSITQLKSVAEVAYYHIELDRHDVIFAENCPAESFRDADCRQRFHNAAEYAGLYPEDEAPQPPCLPLLEEGFYLDVIQRRLATRAGLKSVPLGAGKLRGFVDEAGPERLRGWAQDEAQPEIPVALDVAVGGRVVGRCLANAYRPDLQAAGLGSGCHGFSLLLPPGFSGAVTVRRVGDGAVLPLGAAA